MEKFIIDDTVENFVKWVNWYGETHQSNHLAHDVEENADGRTLLYHGIDRPGKRLGEINFYIEQDTAHDPTLSKSFTVIAEPSSGLNPVRGEVIAYMQEIAVAIRKRWQSPTAKRWQPRSEADRWFLEQYFEVHNGKKKEVAYLIRDEWLRRKKEENPNFDPPNPGNNLQQLIRREKREREQKNLQ